MKDNKQEIDYKQNLINGANSKLFEFAKDMRKESTRAEKMLWEKLRRKGLGYKFRRQHPFGSFIPDFYCHQKRLAIELDGAIHNKDENKLFDTMRTEYLNDHKIYVMRFYNSMVENNLPKVLELVSNKLKKL